MIRGYDKIGLEGLLLLLAPFFFFLEKWEAEAPEASSLRFPFASLLGKMALTTSSPEEKLVAMSRSVAVVVGMFRPNSRNRSRQEVPERNAWTISESPTLGNSVHCLEKRRMKVFEETRSASGDNS